LLSPVIVSNWANVAKVLNAGAQATRLASPDAIIMLHLDRGGDIGVYQSWFDRFTDRVTGEPALTEKVDYDMIGLSWYPYYSSHSSLDNLDANIRNIKARYNKEAVVVETGWAWITEYDGDSQSNLFHHTQENQSAIQMTDVNGYVSASGINFANRPGSGISYIPASPENQARVFRAIFDATVSAGAVGIFWWAADWIPAPGLRSNWDNQTLFDFNGKALPALAVMGMNLDKENPPSRPGGFDAGVITVDSITLNWNRSSKADGHRIEKAITPDGPWTEIFNGTSQTLPPSFTDAGLNPGTDYYYRIMAYNIYGDGPWSSPLLVGTKTLSAPASFRISAVTTLSISLAWNEVSGATEYKIYHVQSEEEPNSSDFTLLASPAAGESGFMHSGLGEGEVHWYKISAVYGLHGEGLISDAIEAAVGTAQDYRAQINMSTGTLDPDFLNTQKASGTNNVLSHTNDRAVYSITGLYAANDDNRLYVAIDFGSSQPLGYENDRIVVWVDNFSSEAGGASLTAANGKIANTQNVTGSIEAVVYKKMNVSAIGGTSGSAINITSWTREPDPSWVYRPSVPSGATVVKFSIPLANIGNASAGNELKIFAAFSMGWNNGNDIYIGGLAPLSAAPGTAPAASSITVNMANALTYIVK